MPSPGRPESGCRQPSPAGRSTLATGNATTTFTDGQMLTVDGTAGVVSLAVLSEGIPS